MAHFLLITIEEHFINWRQSFDAISKCFQRQFDPAEFVFFGFEKKPDPVERLGGANFETAGFGDKYHHAHIRGLGPAGMRNILRHAVQGTCSGHLYHPWSDCRQSEPHSPSILAARYFARCKMSSAQASLTGWPTSRSLWIVSKLPLTADIVSE